MKNALLLSINIGLLVSYLFTYYCHNQITTYRDELTGDLATKYEAIRKERMHHFGIGIFIALVVSAAFYFKSKDMPKFEKLNIVAFLVLFIPMIVYRLMPKSDYMLKHEQPQKDYNDWFDIYLCMKNKSMYGFLSGFTVSMIILSIMDIN